MGGDGEEETTLCVMWGGSTGGDADPNTPGGWSGQE